MLTVIETPMFLRYAASVWGEDEREAFIDWIAQNPEAGMSSLAPRLYVKSDGAALAQVSAVACGSSTTRRK